MYFFKNTIFFLKDRGKRTFTTVIMSQLTFIFNKNARNFYKTLFTFLSQTYFATFHNYTTICIFK